MKLSLIKKIKKMFNKKIIILLTALTILSSCTSFKKAITGEKKKPGDEFLVIKKKPLTLPPDFDDLPDPEDDDITEKEELVEVKKLLKSVTNDAKQSTKTSKGLESSILEKINKN